MTFGMRIRFVLLCLLLAVLSTSVNAVISIGSCEEFQNISSNLSADYILTGNIDCSNTSSWNSGKGFFPIGIYTSPQNISPFRGTVNGNGYTISNLQINRPSMLYVGVFGYVEGNISNLAIVNSSVRGGTIVGGFVGHLPAGKISNCSFTGNVTGSSVVGGFIGHQYFSTITNSYFQGYVVGSQYVGGFAGHQYSGNISQSFSTGRVVGDAYVGGFVGSQNTNGSIVDSYSLSDVYGSSNVGGFIGEQYLSVVARVFSAGYVSGSSKVGGLMGASYNSSSNQDSYWDMETSSQNTSASGTGKTTDQMFKKATYHNWDTEYSSYAINSGYPFLSYQSNESEKKKSLWKIPSKKVNTSSQEMSFVDESILAWWRMDDASESKIIDYTGVTQGTLVGNVVQIEEGVFGKALDFDGNDSSYVKTTGKYNSEVFYISFWSNPRDVTTNKFITDTGNHKRAVMIGYQDGYFNVYSGLGYPTGNSAQTMIPATKDVWQHIVYGSDGQRVYGYKNGELIINVSGNLSSPYNMTYYYLGYGSGGKGRNYNGSLDEIIIFNRSLTPSEVKVLYNSSQHSLQLDQTELNVGRTYALYTQDSSANVVTSEISVQVQVENITVVESEEDASITDWIERISKLFYCSVTDCTIDSALQVNGTLKAEEYLSADGTSGWTGNCINASYKNGIVVGCND